MMGDREPGDHSAATLVQGSCVAVRLAPNSAASARQIATIPTVKGRKGIDSKQTKWKERPLGSSKHRRRLLRTRIQQQNEKIKLRTAIWVPPPKKLAWPVRSDSVESSWTKTKIRLYRFYHIRKIKKIYKNHITAWIDFHKRNEKES